MKKTIIVAVLAVVVVIILFYHQEFAPAQLAIWCTSEGDCLYVLAVWYEEGKLIENGFVCLRGAECYPYIVSIFCAYDCPPAVPAMR